MNPSEIIGEVKAIAPGVWRVRFGEGERVTPFALRDKSVAKPLPASVGHIGECPISGNRFRCRISARGVLIEIDVADDGHVEQFYGLGLQLGLFNQTGRKRTLRVNSDPIGDAGDSHAPVPFFISTAGYGVYVDTARYATFYLGSYSPLNRANDSAPVGNTAGTGAEAIADSTEALYAQRSTTHRVVGIEIPIARGVDIYIFAGPTPLNVVQRYNLFSGGGCLPPLWGLGVCYRAYGKANQDEVLALAKSLRDSHLPCDVLGLEPGWQSRAYSCSFVWNSQLFPEPDRAIAQYRALGFQINLWEHVFVHPESPMYAELLSTAGDLQVWGGLVPDLSDARARQIFTEYHRKNFVAKGITGFKLDECDNSDFVRNSSWSFPESSAFPSGLDGEQMHSLLGSLYQQTINDALEAEDVRTYSSVRSGGAFAAPLPFVLYSDLYDHREFIRGIATAGFSGLLWSPEVRDAKSPEELLRRIETVILSPQALINAWYIKNPPWLQFDQQKNNADDFLDDAPALTESVRKLLRFRMSLIPYLYSAFAAYHFEGVPPFRALVLDYPADPATHQIDDQFMIGADLLAAPFIAGQSERKIYLPVGDWYHFSTHEKYAGGQTHLYPFTSGELPLFVRSGAIVPIAEPVEHVTAGTVFDLTVHPFGPATDLRPTVLLEDDGVSLAFREGGFNRVTLLPDGTVERVGNYDRDRYRVVEWKRWE